MMMDMLEKLKIPRHTQAWTTLEAVGGAEVVGEFYLCAKAKVVDTNMLTNIVPHLWLGDEYGATVGSFAIRLKAGMVFPPEVGKAIKLQTLNAKEVVHSPNGSKLHWHVGSFLSDGLVEGF